MKYALYTGCVAKGAGRELMVSSEIVAQRLGITLVEMVEASCCGAGVIHEDNPLLADTLNARNFAIAEGMGLDIMTICSTCQGVMRKVQYKFEQNPAHMDRTNTELEKDTGRRYQGKVKIKPLYQILDEDYGIDNVMKRITVKLSGLKIAPYYGCWGLRPHETAGPKTPDRPEVIERMVKALGAELVDFPESQKCCGFPILMPNKANSLRLAGNILEGARKSGADVIVTPCPLCHLNLDSYQSEINGMYGLDLELPIIHYSQMVALALGATPKELRMNRHIVKADSLLESVKG